MARGSGIPEPWLIHFFQRHSDDDVGTATPAADYLDSVPTTVAAEFDAILAAVAAAPPPSFSGGGKWEAMHGDMTGIHEVRVRSGGVNYRLFCLLVRTSDQAVRRRVSEVREGASVVDTGGSGGRGLDVDKRLATSSRGKTEICKFRASAIATSVVKVGFFCCCENSLRTAAGGMFARFATSALVNPSS